ncbi:MAG TPA: alpha/beta fold hydrolase [Terriglobales bacterium]|nr:alpha/beta fold hydrolase [Terriglobales bacterium]
MNKSRLLLLGTALLAAGLAAQQPARPAWPTTEGDFTVANFHFTDGEVLPQLRLHYTTLGTLHKNAQGVADNAVLILHGTGGTGHQFLNPNFAGPLFGPGEPLDISRYYIILPDNIGHGKSSKPSDGLHAHFPHYGYHDMIHAQYALLTRHLGVNHLRLVMGTSMGGMHSWMWPEMYPDFMDASMPLASLPVQIAGRNRYFRRMVTDSIKDSPDYDGGEYKHPPVGLRGAFYALAFMTSSPKDWQREMPTQALADAGFDRMLARDFRAYDANDMLYQFASSSDYNPQPELAKIQCWLTAVNSADDQVNPPDLGVMEPNIKKVRHGRYVLIPDGPTTHGHGTHTLANVWKQYLVELLQESAH